MNGQDSLAVSGSAILPVVAIGAPVFGGQTVVPATLPQLYYRRISIGFWLGALAAGALGWWIFYRLV